jgi:hypothetical protein
MATPTLSIDRVLDIPIREVSGLCLHRPPDGAPTLVAIGDATLELAWTALVEGQELRWEVADLSRLGLATGGPGPGSQFEAIATDALGHVLVLREYPAVVHVIDPRERRLLTTIELLIRDGDGLRSPRHKAAASLGEALLLLRDGRLLVSKEKDPPLLFEFGPPGAHALGVDGDRLLRPGEAWAVPRGEDARLEALARWPLERAFEHRFRDISDVAAGPDGRIYLLSDQSSRIARLPVGLPAPGEPVGADATWTLEGRPDKAEGLELLPDGRAIVAIDERKGRGNLFVLGPPIAAAAGAG